MDLSWHRRTPGPIAHPYRSLRTHWGAVFCTEGDVWLLSFGAFGYALGLGWVTKGRRFRSRTRRVGRTL